MKKYIIYLFLSTICLFATSSCSFLEEVSPNDIDADTAIQTAADAEAALLGLYSSMQNKSYYGGQYPLMGEALSDNATTGGYFFISLDQLGAKEVTPVNVIVQDLYIAIYRTIANANYLLTALPNVSDLEAKRKLEIEAQARAIRAMAHFDVLRFFGEHWKNNSEFGIPIIKSVQTITDVPTRATVTETYNFITSELTAAAANIGTLEGAQFINKNTINALLARVYLYKKDNTNAAAFASKVIDSGDYELFESAEYESVFSSRQTDESIFELAFDKQNRSDFNGLTFSREDALRTELYYLASESLNNFFKERKDDVRANLLDFNEDNNDVTIVPDGRTQKYRGEESRDNPAYIIRLAEMYLIRAEAKGVAGLADLNEVRTKRGLPELMEGDIADAAAYQNAILDERRAEFNFEGHRFFDLARLGQIKNVLDIDNFRAILPIPAREIATGQGKMKQNTGY